MCLLLFDDGVKNVFLSIELIFFEHLNQLNYYSFLDDQIYNQLYLIL